MTKNSGIDDGVGSQDGADYTQAATGGVGVQSVSTPLADAFNFGQVASPNGILPQATTYTLDQVAAGIAGTTTATAKSYSGANIDLGAQSSVTELGGTGTDPNTGNTINYLYVNEDALFAGEGDGAKFQRLAADVTYTVSGTKFILPQFSLTDTTTGQSAGTWALIGFNGNSALFGDEPYFSINEFPAYLVLANYSYLTNPPYDDNENFIPFQLATTGTVDPFPCFMEGSCIDTPAGPVAVEELRIGDAVCVLHAQDGASEAPVTWIGRRRIDTARHPDPDTVFPVRIRAGAFADGAPRSDLLVSPDHAVFVDGALVPARMLVNGGSILQDRSIARPHYFHVELARHSVISAEGLAVESFLDTGNRSAFENGGTVTDLHPAFDGADARTGTPAFAPLAVDSATVLPIWTRLAHRAAEIGYVVQNGAQTVDPGFRIVSGKHALAADAHCSDAIFDVPAAAGALRLVSRSARPADTSPWLDDRRLLGVLVSEIRVEIDGVWQNVDLDSEHLAAGWWAVERGPLGPQRWTNGDATLIVPAGATRVAIRRIGEMRYPQDAASLAA